MRLARIVLVASVLIALAGCERQAHNMYRQPRYEWGDASPLFPDGKAMRPPAPGSVPVAVGTRAMTTSGRGGRDDVAQWQVAEAASAPAPITQALLRRGQERYTIYCMPCHSALGDGDGPVAQRGFPHPPSYHDARLRDAPDRHFFDVITNGYGIMSSYADRVTPEDRWAIVAYIRALQLSRQARVAELPPGLRDRIAALPSAAASQAQGGTR